VSKARATPLMLAAASGHVQTCIALVEVCFLCLEKVWW